MGSTIERIGALRHRITIQQVTRTSDGQGGFTELWNNLATTPTVWAKVSPVNKSERLFMQQLEYQRTHKIIIRYRSDLTTDMRISFSNRIFHIKAFTNVEERSVYLQIDAEENTAA